MSGLSCAWEQAVIKELRNYWRAASENFVRHRSLCDTALTLTKTRNDPYIEDPVESVWQLVRASLFSFFVSRFEESLHTLDLLFWNLVERPKACSGPHQNFLVIAVKLVGVVDAVAVVKNRLVGHRAQALRRLHHVGIQTKFQDGRPDFPCVFLGIFGVLLNVSDSVLQNPHYVCVTHGIFSCVLC